MRSGLMALLALWIAAGPVLGQLRAPLALDSGVVANSGRERAVVYSETVRVPGAVWLRLDFGEVVLASGTSDSSAPDDSAAAETGGGSILRLTSLLDGGVQYLNQRHIEQWQHTSAYFNGDAVLVELLAYPGSGPNRVTVRSLTYAEFDPPPGGGDRTICGPFDDRQISNDPRIGRGWTMDADARCSAWLVQDCNRCLITAGHCFASNLQQVHFNVPLSNPDGSINHPSPSDQYVIDPDSWSYANLDVGNDWAHFGCLPNPNTGLTPYEAQLTFFEITLAPPAATGQPIRVTGFGAVDLEDPPPPREWNRAQTTHVGPLVAASGSILRHGVDTSSGNSGSPMIDEANGRVFGIHTHGGCDVFDGENAGTALNNAGFQGALAAPKGVCTPVITLTSPAPGSATVRDGSQVREVEWPVPSSFAIVADATGLVARAVPQAEPPSTARSFYDYVRFVADDSNCTDFVGTNGEFFCTLTPSGGAQTIRAEADNPWGQLAATDSVDVLYYRNQNQPRNACWLTGTQITMADGSTREIEDVFAGAEILAYDLLSGETLPARVHARLVHTAAQMTPYYLVITAGEGQAARTLRVTPNHVLVRPYAGGPGEPPGSLVFAGDLVVGDWLLTPGGALQITSISQVNTQVTTYNLDIRGETRLCNPYLAYIAEGVVAFPLKGDVALMAGRALFDYDMVDLGALIGAADTIARGVNNNQTVVGSSGTRAFAWTYDGGLTELGVGVAYAVNSLNQIAGTSNGRAVRWQLQGGFTDIAAGAAYDISDAGQVVGQTGTQAFRWQDGQLTLLGAGVAYAVNNSGYAAGTSNGRAIIWRPDGTTIDLGPGVAYGLNDNLQAVGESGGQAFIWEDGQLTAFGPGIARAINVSGLVVGENGGVGFLREPGGTVRPLSELIWPWSGWSPTVIHDVSDGGAMVGRGSLFGLPRGFHALSTSTIYDRNGNSIADICEPGGTDCNDNGIPDEDDISMGTSLDCNGNGVPDECDVTNGNSPDCNGNNVPDECDVISGDASDCNGNLVPDSCDLLDGTSEDCNGNSTPDECDIADGTAPDCNGNEVPDSCDLASGVSQDCTGNGIPDECDIAGGAVPDCNGNLVPDSCDLDSGFSQDCTGNGVPDECDIAGGAAEDCNANGVPDPCDLAAGTSEDCNHNGIPDECDIAGGAAADCNGNGVPDTCDVADGTSPDCNENNVPDECDIASGTSTDLNGDGVPDECQDCNGNGIPDDLDLANGTSFDCNGNGTLDECDLAAGTSEDCNENLVPDECDIAAGTSTDLNSDGIPDDCQDCNGNGIPDDLDIAGGTSLDLDGNGIPDECQVPDVPLAPRPEDDTLGASTCPRLSVLVTNWYDGPVDVRFMGVLPEQFLSIDSTADWDAGDLDGTVSDGAGNLILADTGALFGDGRDGDLNVTSGTHLLEPGRQYMNVNVSAGATLDTRGYPLRVAGLLFNQGVITDTVSGGAGGTGGEAGRGQDPKQNDNPPGPTTAQPGQCGEEGLPGAGMAGHGGRGGGGGGGGGGAQSNTQNVDADGGWFPGNPADRRGRGGDGGRGGGHVIIYARALQNHGLLSASGEPGQPGQPGGDGQYTPSGGLDLAGGGGGGGAGGDGGDGGTLEVIYENLVHLGQREATGGQGGLGGNGGLGHFVFTGTNVGLFFQGAAGACGGGNGGAGEYRRGRSSASGSRGADGVRGANGTVSIQQLEGGYIPSGQFTSAPLCLGSVVDWTAASINATTPAGTSVQMEFSADGAAWHGDIVNVPDSQCLFVRLTLESADRDVTPIVHSVSIGYIETIQVGVAADVPSGGRASVSWAELERSTVYCWYAIAEDPAGGSATSPIWCFETGEQCVQEAGPALPRP